MSENSSQPTYAESAGSIKSSPIKENDELQINDKIMTITDVVLNPINQSKINNELNEFYKDILLANIEFNKSGNGTFSNEFIKTYFKTNFKNIIYNSRSNTSSDPSTSIIFSNYEDKETKKYNNLAFNTDTYQIIDYNYHKEKIDSPLIDEEKITSIKDIIDGPCIIMVIKDGLLGIRTVRTFTANGTYDSTKTHAELFKQINESKKVDFDEFKKFSKSTPDMYYCFHFVMQLNHTPFPKNIPNEIYLLKSYMIKDKTEQLEVFNKKLSELITIKDDSELIKKNIESISDYIKTELIVDYIKQFDISEMQSLLFNLKCGKLLIPKTYSYNTTDKVQSQIDAFMKLQYRDYKGLYIETDNGKKYEILNYAYDEMSKYRIKYSIHTKNNDKNLFLQYLHLLYKNIEQEKSANENNIILKKENLYSSKFHTIYGEDNYRSIFDDITVKLSKFIDLLFDTYNGVNRYKTINFKEIPPCFRYYNMKMNRRENFINKIHYDVFSVNRNMNQKFVIHKSHIKNYIINTILKQYYDENINKSESTEFTYKNIHNNILKPITKYEPKDKVISEKTLPINLL